MTAEWIEQAVESLDMIRGRGARQKRDVILAVVTAKINGESANSVITGKDAICNESTFYNWLRDPLFKRVMDDVEALAFAHQDRDTLEKIKRARRMLAQAAPAAVNQLTRLLLTSEDPKVRLQAANSILDRASMNFKDEEQGNGDTARRSVINSDTMAGLIQEALKQRGNLIQDEQPVD